MYAKFCCCSLAGTKACENCGTGNYWTSTNIEWPVYNPVVIKDDFFQNWINEFEKLFNDSNITTNVKKLQLVDTDEYDIVEKKDAKIKKLKESIEAFKRQKDNNRTLINMKNEKIKEFSDNIKKCDEDIEKLEQELKQLEEGK